MVAFFHETTTCRCKAGLQNVPAAVGWALLGFSAGSLLCWWLLVGRQACRFPSLSLGCKIVDSLRSLCKTDSSLTGEEERILAQRRFEKLQALMDGTSTYLAPSLNIMAIGLAAFALAIQPVTLFFAFYQSVMGEGLLFAAFALYFAHYKTQLSARVADAIMLTLFLLFGLHGALAASDYAYVSYYHRFAVLAQISISQLIASSRHLFVVNTINLAFQMSVVLSSPALRADIQTHIACFVLSYILNFAASSAAAAGLRYESRAIAAERQASRGEATAMSLLTAMCDAVVILRPDLTLRALSQKLNALLLRTGFGAGDPFSRLLQQEDVQRFVDFIARQAQTPNQAGVLHVHLVDSMGNKIAARLFHTCTISDDDGSLTHMVGVAEERSEQENADYFPAVNVLPVSQRRAPRDQQAAASSDWQDFARLVPAGFDTSSQASSARSLDPLAPTMMVTLRTSLSCQVMSECELSRTLFGFSSLSQLEFLGRIKEWKKLLMTLELMHAELACGSDALPQRFGEVNIFTPATQSEHRGVLDISVSNVAKPADGESGSSVHLNYCDFQLLLHQRSAKSATSRREKRRPQPVPAEAAALPGAVPEESPNVTPNAAESA